MAGLGEPPPDPGGTKSNNQQNPSQSQEVNVQSTVTSTKVGDSGPKQMRSFKQILAEEKQSRNILELKITKLMVDTDGAMGKAKGLGFEDISVLIFDIVEVKPEHCMAVALSTVRYDTKEVKLKPGVDPSQYTTKDTPITFKDHKVEVTIQSLSVTKVTFKNVPFSIPDEEIINLCKCYGEPIDNIVQYERPSRATRGWLAPQGLLT